MRAAARPVLGILLLSQVELIENVLAQLLLAAAEELRHNRVIKSLLQHDVLERGAASVAQLGQTAHQLGEVLDGRHFRGAGESFELRESLEVKNKDKTGVREGYH